MPNNNRVPARYRRDGGRQVVNRPADAPVEEPAAPAAPPETSEAPAPQQPAEMPLSYTGIDYQGYGTIVLHEIDKGESPVRIEQVIKRWEAVPKASRFDVLGFPHFVYCFNKQNNKIDPSVIPPDALCASIIEDHEQHVREHMAKLTGEQPADSTIADLAKTLSSMSKDELFDVFNAMDNKALQTVLDAAHGVNKQRRRASSGQQQPGGRQSGQQPGQGSNNPPKQGSKPAPAPTPQPAPRPAPQPAPRPQQPPAPPAPARPLRGRQRAAWSTNT